MGYGNENQGYAIPIPVIQNLIEAGAIERIGEYAVAAHEAKNKVPLDYSIRFCTSKDSDKTYFYRENATKKGEVVEFFDGIIQEIILVNYEPKFGFDDGRLLIYQVNKNQNMVFIANNCWGKKEMIQILRDHGIIFRVCKNDSFILRMFMEHLAEFQVTKYIKCDPRAGWVQCNSECELTLYPELIGSPIQSKKEYKWKFQTADSWLFDIPAFAAKKTLLTEKTDSNRLNMVFIMDIFKSLSPFLLLLFSILFVGITTSRLVQRCNFIQEKIILINCKNIKTLQVLKNFFSFYIEDKELNLTLSMQNKKLQKILSESKDQLIVIDADTEDVSGRRKRNIATLQNYVCSGSLSDGQKADAVVILLSRGISAGISLDDALIFDVDETDQTFFMLQMNEDIRGKVAQLVSYLIHTIENTPELLEGLFWVKSLNSNIARMLSLAAETLLDMEMIKKCVSEPKKILAELKNLISSAEMFADVEGISSIVAEIILKKIQKKEGMKLRMAKDKVDKKELNFTILMDKKALYLSDTVLINYILPELASANVTPVTLRKVLAHEGLINRYTSESGSKSNKKKRPIYSKDGKLYYCHMTEINRERLEELTEVDFDELMELVQDEK